MILKSLEKLRTGLRDAVRAGEGLAERVALAEVDAAIQTRVQGMLIPSLVVAALFAVAQIAAAVIGDPEALRIATTSIVLAAGLYGLWALTVGIGAAVPVVAVWWAAPTTPHNLARLLLYELILTKLRQTFTSEEGRATTASHVVRYALKFSGGPSSWESYAMHLADRIAPRMVRHGLLRVAMVVVPVLIAWGYYRLVIFPDVIRAQTGLGVWGAFLYPFAALIDAVAGTHLRQILLH